MVYSGKKEKAYGIQMSDAVITSAFLTASGGFQDAYTYFYRDEVFANAQTGNIVLMAHHLFSGELAAALRYLLPLAAFAIGIFVAEHIRQKYRNASKIHWRQIIVIAEMVILFSAGFMGQELNTLATALISFSCAMQVQSFRKINGFGYASTMCIGNLRSGTEAYCVYRHTGDEKALKGAKHYFAVIGFFAVGAGLGSVATQFFGASAIWISCLLLAVSAILMTSRSV
ncbi:MAG: hypothetical protein PWQ12_1566 [Clostridiales bacterium]|jgi:uncharacterized membrane protein YoaK (UPF0700 family)|nr:hypothetical protein [Clostridiales bacterium]